MGEEKELGPLLQSDTPPYIRELLEKVREVEKKLATDRGRSRISVFKCRRRAKI